MIGFAIDAVPKLDALYGPIGSDVNARSLTEHGDGHRRGRRGFIRSVEPALAQVLDGQVIVE
ncbi:hypothetical protein M4D52_30290, partial [Paenibacillus lactis]